MLEKLQWLLIGLLVVACVVLFLMLSSVQTKVDRANAWIYSDTGAAGWMKSEPPKVRGRFDDICKQLEALQHVQVSKCGGPHGEPPKDGPGGGL